MLFHTWKLWRNKSLFWRLFLIILAINLSMCHSISVASSQPFTQRFSKLRKYLLIQCNGRLLNLSMSIYHLIHRTSGNDETYLILVLHRQSSNLGRKLEPKKNRYFFSKLEITKTSLWNSSKTLWYPYLSHFPDEVYNFHCPGKCIQQIRRLFTAQVQRCIMQKMNVACGVY